MYERHSDTMRKFLFSKRETEITDVLGQKIEVETSDGKRLRGVLVGKSIAIPVSTDMSSDSFLNEMAGENLRVLSMIGSKTPFYLACEMLGFNPNVNTNGVFADSDFFGTFVALHLHPGGSIDTQEEFLKMLGDMFVAKNLKMNIIGPLLPYRESGLPTQNSNPEQPASFRSEDS